MHVAPPTPLGNAGLESSGKFFPTFQKKNLYPRGGHLFRVTQPMTGRSLCFCRCWAALGELSCDGAGENQPPLLPRGRRKCVASLFPVSLACPFILLSAKRVRVLLEGGVAYLVLCRALSPTSWVTLGRYLIAIFQFLL